jgi:hypothetical protein
MKLHLILLTSSLFNLSSGLFTVELTGPLTEEPCTGEEYADFKHCVMLGAEADPSIDVLTDVEENSSVNLGGVRHLGNACTPCTGREPRGTFCFTYCPDPGRRLQEKGSMDHTPNLRRGLQKPDSVSALFKGGTSTGNDEAKEIGDAIMACLGDNHPCLGSTVDMTMTVTL